MFYGGDYWTKMELNKFISNRVMNNIVPGHVVTYPAKQQTSRWTDIPYPIHRVIVSDMPLHRTVCCYIVPGAAKLSSVCGDRVQVIP